MVLYYLAKPENFLFVDADSIIVRDDCWEVVYAG